MAAVLLRNEPRRRTDDPRSRARARDWAEIQERMLVPLYEAVYERLEIGPRSRLLGVGCGSGLALLMAACRGAAVSGVDPDEERLRLARERLLPDEWQDGSARTALRCGGPESVMRADPEERPFNVVTLLDPPPETLRGERERADRVGVLAAAARLAEPGSPVVLAGWGPSEQCETSAVLRVAARPDGAVGATREAAGSATPPTGSTGQAEVEDLVRRAGLRPEGSGRVSCPFAYPDLESAVRGLRSTGWFDAATEADAQQVDKELREALHPFRLPDGTVRMENVFRYVVARA